MVASRCLPATPPVGASKCLLPTLEDESPNLHTQPGGLATPSLFDVNHMSNFGNFYGSMPPNYKKEYKDYLIKNYLSNHTVDYAKIALGRNDLDGANINLPTFVTGHLHYLIHAILNNRLNSRDEIKSKSRYNW